MAVLDELLASWQGQQDRANAANELRYNQGMEILDEIIGNYSTGGSFEKATEAALKRGSQKAVASGTQSLVSSGLSNTTQAAGLSKKFEEEVGAPTRLKAADVAAQRLTEAKQAKVGFIERREDTGPSFGDIAGLISQISQGSAAQGYAQQYSAPSAPQQSLAEWTKENFGGGASYSSRPSTRRASSSSSSSRTSGPSGYRAPKKSAPKLDISYQAPIYGSDFHGPPPGGDVQRQPDIVKDAYTSFGQNAAMFKNYF